MKKILFALVVAALALPAFAQTKALLIKGK